MDRGISGRRRAAGGASVREQADKAILYHFHRKIGNEYPFSILHNRYENTQPNGGKQMNVITLTGYAVRDTELRFTPNGKGVANGSIAVRRDFKNQQGEYETDFINFIALGGLSEVMANHIKKGDKFGITGRLQIRKWEKDNGEKQYFTEVIVNSFDFPSKTKSEGSQQNTEGNNQKRSQGENKRVEDDPFTGAGQIDISDDDLPF